MDELLIKLEKRVRIVRTARIEAAKRYKKDNDFYRWITIVYSILMTCLSIWFVVPAETIDNTRLSPILLSLATFVTLFTMYSSIKNPGEKVGKFQSNYMELTRLMSEIQSFLKIINVYNYGELIKKEEYDKFSKRYSTLLTQSENHDDIDYRRAILREEDNDSVMGKIKINIAEKKILNHNIFNYTKRIIAMISLPVMFILFYFLERILSVMF